MSHRPARPREEDGENASSGPLRAQEHSVAEAQADRDIDICLVFKGNKLRKNLNVDLAEACGIQA